MPWSPRWLALLLLLLLLLDPAVCSYSEDQCSWRGSGLSQEAGSVEQISLHCAEGSLEWLYPAGALRLSLSPRLPTGPAGKEKPQHVTACIKSSNTFRGAQIYLERDGVLELLLSETDAALQPKVRCFRWMPREKVALFLQSTLHRDISRRIAAFRYELWGEWSAHFSWSWRNLSVEDAGTCRPCNNTEILMAVCTSDFDVSLPANTAGVAKLSHETSLHWLPVAFRVRLKVLVTTFKVLHGLGPGYLQNRVLPANTSHRPIRSHREGLLRMPPARQSRLATPSGRAFSVAAPTLWNDLSPEIGTISDLRAFRRALKTHRFAQAGLA